MTIDEAIKHVRESAEKCRANTNIEPQNSFEAEAKKVAEQEAEKNKQLGDWLEELKELREYKARMEMQYLDDIGNPLEPLKLHWKARFSNTPTGKSISRRASIF